MLDLVKIGQYITKLRIDHNMTQKSLADKLYVTHQAVSKWENGKAIPTIDIMYELTKLFQVSIDELICTAEQSDDFPDLLKRFPRNYCINQLINGKFKTIKLEEIMYLLSQEERSIIISHIINQNISADIEELFPYLNTIERIRILDAIVHQKLNLNINNLFFMLKKSEKEIFNKEDLYEHSKNATLFR